MFLSESSGIASSSPPIARIKGPEPHTSLDEGKEGEGTLTRRSQLPGDPFEGCQAAGSGGQEEGLGFHLGVTFPSSLGRERAAVHHSL